MRAFLLIALVTLCYSCDNRKDPYYNLDNAPVLEVMKLSDQTPSVDISDSIKIGQVYTFMYSINSFENLNLNIEKSNESDSVLVDNNLIHVSGCNIGISTYNLKTKDSFGKSAMATVQLTTFNNLKPICNFTVKKVGQLSPYEIQVDASTSYDPDAKWGGHVVWYEYQIQTDYDKTVKLSSINYICAGTGQKKVTVRIQDNEGMWSDWVTEYFVLD